MSTKEIGNNQFVSCSPNMLPKHRSSYLVLRIGLNHLNPSGFLLLASCSPAAACLLLPACCCLRLPATYLLACCRCLPRLLPAARLLLLLASACLPTCCLLPASSASCLVLPSPPPLWPHLAPPWVWLAAPLGGSPLAPIRNHPDPCVQNYA